VTFDYEFLEDTEITGYMKLRVWVEANGSDDADFFVAIQKIGVAGDERPTLVLGARHPGAWGRLRVSHRELDAERSTETEPFHAHRNEHRLSAGEVVVLDIPIWPTSRVWHAGESLRVQIAGHYIRDAGWREPFRFETRNRGQHIIHTGDIYDSYLVIPVIPRFAPVVPDRARMNMPM
jgi:uncharacterized protein